MPVGGFLLLQLLGCKTTKAQVFRALLGCHFSANSPSLAQRSECWPRRGENIGSER